MTIRSLILGAALLAASACSAKYDTDTGVLVGQDGGDGADGGNDGADGGDGSDNGLPDLLDDAVETGNCEGYDGVPVTGASVYWYGEFISNGDGGWVGEEHWILWANEHWEDNGGQDCVVVWNLTAVEAGPGACPTCSSGLVTQGSVDRDRTTCDPDLWSADADTSTHYGLFRDGQGGLQWYWAGSGNYMADGYESPDGNLNFLIDEVCRWF